MDNDDRGKDPLGDSGFSQPESGPKAGSQSAPGFKAAWARGGEWGPAAKACATQLEELPDGANIGFLYLTDAFTKDVPSVLTFLREKTGIQNWVGTVGLGVLGSGVEYHDRGALSVLIAALPPGSFQTFNAGRQDAAAAVGAMTGDGSGGAGPGGNSSEDALSTLLAAQRQWLGEERPGLAIVHGDPRNVRLTEIVEELAEVTAPFLVGGLAASRIGEFPQIADRVVDGGVSGVLLKPEIEVVTGLTQGCSPIGPLREVTQASDNVIKEIDGRPAFEVFKEDIGELLSRDLRRIAGYIFAAFPMHNSDMGDYLVRNLMSLDTERGWVSVGESVEPGRKLLFCRRDHAAAEQDMRRMLKDVKARCGEGARAGLYFSCVGRGQNLFGSESEEMKMIQEEFGDLPIAGFFANGEISRDRVYGYTGVLTLFR